MTEIRVDDEAMGPVVNRLKRAHGQLAGVLRMLEEGRDCEAVVTQLAAVSKAVSRAGFAIISSGMQQCLRADFEGAAGASDDADGAVDAAPAMDVAKMEKLFLSLA